MLFKDKITKIEVLIDDDDIRIETPTYWGILLDVVKKLKKEDLNPLSISHETWRKLNQECIFLGFKPSYIQGKKNPGVIYGFDFKKVIITEIDEEGKEKIENRYNKEKNSFLEDLEDVFHREIRKVRIGYYERTEAHIYLDDLRKMILPKFPPIKDSENKLYSITIIRLEIKGPLEEIDPVTEAEDKKTEETEKEKTEKNERRLDLAKKVQATEKSFDHGNDAPEPEEEE